MIAAITNHLWQSTLFVLAAGVLAFALRKNGAHIRHCIWLIASLKFLVPFSLLMSLGVLLAPARPAPSADLAIDPAPLSVAVDRLAQPFVADSTSATAPRPEKARASGPNWTTLVLAATWACGFMVVVTVRARGWRRIRAALRESVPARIVTTIPVRSSAALIEPGVVGIRHPVLLVPASLEVQLTRVQLDAVIAHELCHVRRGDNLTSAIHMIVEAIFWFHPLVWVVGARLLDERERACDEHVLRVCGEPQAYAESILNVCKLYLESPVACVSGVSGADLKRRVSAIMSNRIGLRLSRVRKAALTIAAMLALTLPIVVGMMTAPLRVSAFAQTSDKPQKFDVASVKPCGTDAPPTGARSGTAGQSSPGYLILPCYTLRQLVSTAYAGEDTPLRTMHGGWDYVPGNPKTVRGGPEWAYTETFTVEAKSTSATDRITLTGPMLRSLLEDRFQLKVHRATEERSAYALTVAKSGLKIKPTTPDECWDPGVRFDPARPVPPHAPDAGPCGGGSGNGWGSIQLRGVMFGDTPTLPGTGVVDALWRVLLKVVIDRTGLKGRYSFDLEFTPDDNTPGVHGRCGGNPDCMSRLAANGIDDSRPAIFPSNANIFKALENVGLHLEPIKAPGDYLVIDSAQHPRPDTSEPPTVQGPGGPFVPETVESQAFEVASIKPCDPNSPPTIGGAPGMRGYAPWVAQTSPGHVVWTCATLSQLIDQAYVESQHPLLNVANRARADSLQGKRVRGGPGWVETEKFAIEAKIPIEAGQGAAGNSLKALTPLPAAIAQSLRTMLEDRFQLKVHRVTDQQEMYALTIAKNGLNKDRMKVTKTGDCVTAAQYFATDLSARDRLEICGRYNVTMSSWRFAGGTMPELAQALSSMMDYYVADKTGETGTFTYVLDFAPLADVRGDDRFIAAAGALGLKLDRTKGPAEYIQIDTVQRPRPNRP